MLKYQNNTINSVPFGTTGINRIYLGENLVYEYLPPAPPNYFYSEAIEDGTFTLTIASTVSTTMLTSISYSLDDGTTWTTTNNVNNSIITVTTPNIQAGERVLWKGIGKTYAYGASAGQYSTFSGSADYNVGGDIGYLFYGDNYNGTFSGFESTHALQHFFYQSTHLINAESLILSPINCAKDRSYQSTFHGCSNLITPPTILMEVASGAYCCYDMFNGCSSLIEAPKIVATTAGASNSFQRTFYNCSSMTKADLSSIQSDITLAYTFYNCYALKDVALPPNITNTGIETFRNCYALEEVDFGSGTGGITIGQYAFSCTNANRGSLKSLPFDRVEHLGNNGTYSQNFAHQDLEGETVDLSNLADTKICDQVFWNTKIKKVTSLGSVLTTLSGGFRGCSFLEEVHLPLTVTSLGDYVFDGCSALTLITGLNNITTIGRTCFSGTGLTSIVLPSLTTAGGSLFSSCGSLEHAELPALISVGDSLFHYDTKLKTVDIGSNVTSLAQYTFYGCLSIEYIVIRAVTPPTIGNQSFSSVPSSAKIYVPYGSLSAYQTANNWSSQASKMIELNPDGTIPS